MPYQPQKLIERYIHGCTLLRPIPTNPSSLMCKMGFHNLSEFDTSKAGRSWQKYGEPTYCTRCYHSNWGNIIPRKPPYRSYATKGEALLNKESELLRELDKISKLKGYLDSRRSQLSEELNALHNSPHYPVNEAKRYPAPPKMPVPPEPRIIRENGKPPGDE